MMKNKQRIIGIAMAMLITLAGAGSLYALRPPHDSSRGIVCGSCHKTNVKIRGFNPLCISECHNSLGMAKNKGLDLQVASNIFGTFTLQTGAKKYSHAWSVQPNYSTVGKNNRKAGTNKTISINQPNVRGVSGASTIICPKCHYAHGTTDEGIAASGGTVNKPFVRASTKGNFICFQCHDERRVSNVRDPLPAEKAYSHPVEVNYSSAHASKPTFFESSPTNIYGTDAARLPLYTTYGNVKGAVVCSTCHGPMHSADSNPYTFDNMSLFSMNQYSASSADGRLLRRYGKAKDVNNELCKACHKVTAHKGFNCYRCHTPHKRQGEQNRYLILENISTPNNGIRPIYFEYTTGMARRYGKEFTANGRQYYGGYSQAKSRLDKTRPTSSAICQACHTTTKYMRNYSATGTVTRVGGAPSAHPSVYTPGTGKYRACIACHVHTDAFNPTGGDACTSCHDAPPFDTYSSGSSATVIGRHNKHVNDVNGSNPGSSYNWGDGTLDDARLPNAYGFSCGRCHNPWNPYTGIRHKPATLTQGTYTAEIGFNIRADQALPKNPNATYTRGTRGPKPDLGSNYGDGINWSVPGTGGGTCYNLYCHGQWYNGYTSNNPTFTGTQTCGKCHGAKPNDPPGKTNGVNYGAHPRHVGNANNQQYGSASPMNFRCNACHYPTVQGLMTSIEDRSTHVDGRVNLEFSGGGYGNANSTYGGFADYTSRKPQMTPWASSRPAYKTCGLIYCHSDGSRTQGNYSVPFNAEQGSGTTKFPNWSSSSSGNFTTTLTINSKTFKRRCSRCHGNSIYKGITAAMPGYATRAGKGNSHETHIKNGFLCNVCHSATVNADNKSIASTNKHVNKTWDIKILRSYSGIYDPDAHTCSMVSCHGRKTTPIWGNTAVCQNCHLSSTGDVDKRIKVSNTFQSFSEAAAKIYSTQWADTGHGRNAGSYGSGNQPAAKVCTDCHEAAIKHGTGSNPFRLLTAPDRPNMVCERCHGVGASEPGVNKTGIQTHASSVVQTGKHNFAIKCIDCHDPHGDNNARFMVHSTVARPLITGNRAESSNLYGQRQTNVTSSNVDFVANQYTSDYASKYKAAKICQVCHTRTVDRDTNSPTYLKGRFRWYSASDKAHGSGKCTSCHSHGGGFKGAGCNGCHGFPPINVQTVLSGAGRTLANLDNRQRPSGSSSSEAATAGAHQKHFGSFSSDYKVPPKSLSTICSFCHQGGMYATGSPSSDIEIGFNAFTDYSGSSQKYSGQLAVKNGYYGYSGIGMAYDGTMSCNVKCHGAKGAWLTKSFGNVTAPRWNDTTRNSVFCGSCHGAKKAKGVGSWPTTNAHTRHAGTNTDSTNRQYDFMCKLCHNKTVLGTATTLSYSNAHVDGKATFEFYTGSGGDSKGRVWSQSIYTGGDTKVNSGFGRCQNLYCHSRGTTTSPPYTGTAVSNYTAKWTATNLPAGNAKCSYCHGNKGAGGYKGITSAMPNYTSSLYGGPKANSHRKHVIENGFMCNVCHSRTINSANNSIIFTNGTTRHLNKVYDIAILSAYSGTYNGTTCSNVKCHAKNTTPAWGNKIICQNCHMTGSGVSTAEDNFAWTNFSGAAAKIYSTEWTGQGHGRARADKYAFSNNSGAAKTCTNCHKPAVKHGDANNYFRLMTSNPDRLCLACHGLGAERIPAIGFSRITGIQSHTWANISTAGYVSAANGGNKRKAAIDGGWNFGAHDSTDKKKVKCVDCHDPHGDGSNNYMMHKFPNFSGSDRVGRPTYTATGMQMTFSTVGGPQMNWSSYVKPLGGELGICQRCHTPMTNTTAMTNFNKGKYSDHNRSNRCTKCHKHKQGFKPSGCDGCHGYPPPNGPTSPNNWLEQEASPSTVGLHTPHAKNPRNRPGIAAENDVAGAAGFKCNRCHANTADGADASMGSSNNKNAIMTQLESVYGNWTAGPQLGYQSVTDDTCNNIKCHTPRYYERTWKKPTGCDDCHGYRNKTNLVFKVQTTNAHKIHVSYTTAGYDKKKYGLACSNCHYNWQGLNNYSTHYSSYVNITAMGPVNTIGGQFYGRGRVFKGFSTGGELTNAVTTCSKVYCHGNFVNGTTQNPPIWKKGAMSTTCGSCHKAKTAKVSGWATGSLMPEAHPKHVVTAEYNFACARCHTRTVTNNTTILFSYSSHVNGTKNVVFNTDLNNDGGNFNFATARKCKNIYCHSSGYRSSPAGSFTTRTTLGRYTASWNDFGANRNTKTGNRPCSYCHGNNTYAGVTAAMPNQTSLWGNSHRTHVIRNNFRCVNCHSATVSSAGTINYAGGRHVDGFKTITIIGAYKSGATNYGAGMTCDNVKCHAGKTTPKWGTYITCQNCHLSNTGDTDKRISANNTFQYYTAKTGATAPRIYSTAWRNVGHGRQSAYSSGNPAANKTCTNCHKASVAHGTASNPFRLYTINSVNGNPNTLCNDCHGANPGTPASKVGILTHASSVTQTGRHNFAIKCIDCHDPHGDNNRRFMVHSTVVRPRITGTRAEISNANGSIFLSATGRNVDFNQNLYTSDYAKKVTAAKICQVCHTRTFKPNSAGVTRFRWNGSNDNSHGTGKCTNCHSHTQGFKGAACNSCHGFPPASANTLIGRPGTNQARTMSGSTTAGAHLKHVTVFGSSNDTCNKCHSGGMAFDSNENDDITLKFVAFNRYTGVNQKYQGQSAVRTGFYGYSGDGAGTSSNQTCSNMKCHGAKGNWLTKNFGTPSAPVWNSSNSVFCGSCHGAKKGAGNGSYPATNAHRKHAGWATGEYDFKCQLCHSETVTGNYTTLNDSTHVNAESKVDFSSSGDSKVDGNSGYSGDLAVNSTFGKCSKTYCHSSGADKVAPFDTAGSFANFTANWPDNRGSYKAPVGSIAKCKYCHGNKNIANYTGVLAAMPNYADGSPKANKHPKHVGTYNFLCSSCHVNTTVNNTSIDAASGMSNHVNQRYNVNFNTNTRNIDNSGGLYTSIGGNGTCRTTYCHSKGSDFASYVIPNYTAHWGDDRGSYKQPKANMAKCNYCHGSRNTYSGMTSAMPNYVNNTPKANRHPMHVTTYGFTCTVCHNKVTTNNTSIDASGGRDRHVNKTYNIDFSKTAPFANNTGTYVYSATSPGSKCKNTYCHSRGTDNVKPYSTRTSFANWTARWGDDRGSYKQANGLKAKCNYCHGNRLFSGITSAMPNYTSAATNTAKWNTHPIHVRGYGFTCNVCHVKVAANNTSISDSSLHVNMAYNVNFKANVRGNLTNNTGVYVYTDLTTKNKCKNTYCHSRGTDFTKPYNTRTSFANWTARWGDSRGGYKQANGLKAKCNYCHGNRRYSGMTSAMPNYSGNYSGTPAGVTAKANSHKKHVIDNGFVCSTCHYGVVPNNTSISDRSSHVNAFYNISITPTQKSAAGKAYSTNWTNRNAGGTCMNNKCHGTSKPKWGDPQTAACKLCHFSGTADKDNYARNDGVKAEIYSSEWRRKGHGKFDQFTSRNLNRCERCHKPAVGHNTATNPFRLMTSAPDKLCAGCHGSATERNASWGVGINATNVDYKTHSKANAGKDAAWNTHSSVTGKGPKCIDCHDPHGDKNSKMIHSYINHSGSDRFGRPAGRPWNDGAINYTTAAMMTFTSWNYGVQLGWSTFSNGVLAQSLCRRCHTPVGQDTGMGNDPASSPGNMTKANYAGTHQSHQKCTNCHDHKAGFQGGGESTGNMSCDGCHGSGGNPDLSPMLNGQTRSYHHVLQNTSAVGGNKYPITNNLTTVGDSRRRCLMCHVDHNVFRPDMNGGDPRGRAANLRANIFTKGTSNLASTRSNSDWSGTDPYGGICLSCHTRAQRKNTAKQYNDGSKFTLRIQTSQFRNSPHNYTAIGVINTDGSKFKANCLKCHNDTTPKVKFKSNSGFSAHDSKLRRLNSQLGLTIYEGVVGAGSTGTRLFTAGSPGWTPNNNWATRVVTIKPTTAGTGREQTRIILTNTTSRLTVNKAWKSTPVAGDYFTIGDPPEEDYCFNCHSPYSNPNYSQSKDYYGMVTFVNKKALKMEMVFKGEANSATGGTSGANPTLSDTAADTIWAVDAWKDFVVKIIGGTGAGQTGVVTSNTAGPSGTLTMTAVGASWKKAPDATSEYSLGNPYKHRIENFGGVHQSDEMVRAPAGVTTYGWFTTLGQGYKPHVGCTDCHNPHAQRKPGVDRGITEKTLSTITTLHIPGKTWNTNEFKGLLAVAIDRSNAGEERMIVENSATKLRVGTPFSAKMTGVYVTIYPKGRAFVAISTATGAGNMLSGPNNGQWGVKVVSWRKPTPKTADAIGFDNLSSPVMSKMTTLTSGKDRVYNLCFKCHSRYAWGTSGKPFNIQNTFTTNGDTKFYREGPSADIASRFNPNNLAHHAVIRPGQNQPIVPNYGFTTISSYYNPNWPSYKTAGGGDTLAISSGAATLAGVAKLPLTVIPGWYVYVGSDTPNGNTTGVAAAGTASTGWVQIRAIASDTSFTVTPAVSITTTANWAISAGFGNNFVPPIGPWSVIACTDCHDTSSASDPAGPHGSGFRWILRGLEPQAFPWFNGTNVITIKYSNVGWASAATAKYICLNCHRADVYGSEGNLPNGGTLPVTSDDPGNWQNFVFDKSLFSRQQHPVDPGLNSYDVGRAALTVFGINCMHCHAGSALGQIHGTNLGVTWDDSTSSVDTKVTSNASWRGKRFLTGGSWTGIRRSSTTAFGACWVDGGSAAKGFTPDAIASCNDDVAGGTMDTGYATYNFDAGSDY